MGASDSSVSLGLVYLSQKHALAYPDRNRNRPEQFCESVLPSADFAGRDQMSIARRSLRAVTHVNADLE
jgi:hypothetical protein